LQRMHAVAVPYSGSSLSHICSANGASLCVLLPEGRIIYRFAGEGSCRLHWLRSQTSHLKPTSS
jgi:hypothetical protein